MQTQQIHSCALLHGQVLTEEGFFTANLRIEEGRISYFQKIDKIQQMTPEEQALEAKMIASVRGPIIDAQGLFIFPGFVDVHVHFREPGHEEKETIRTGSLAAAHGGYTVCCPMPNLKPVPDSLDHLQLELDRIRETACIHVLPYGAITVGEAGKELADLEALAPYVAAFSDDGVGLNRPDLMKAAMTRTKALGKLIAAHEEDKTLVQGGVVHDGAYAKRHGLPGNPAASEYLPVQRDLALAQETGAPFHICHISSRQSLQALRAAQAAGADVSGETAPHYLVLNDEDLQDEGRFRMNPPIRSRADQVALLTGLKDGTLLAIATDHAPHTAAEKAGGLRASLNGVVGLETAFPILYTHLVKTGFLSLEDLVYKMSTAPLNRFRLYEVKEAGESLGIGRGIKAGQPADLTLFDLEDFYRIDPEDFLSKGKASPFAGREVYGRCLLTLVGGQPAFQDRARIKNLEVPHAGQ